MNKHYHAFYINLSAVRLPTPLVPPSPLSIIDHASCLPIQIFLDLKVRDIFSDTVVHHLHHFDTFRRHLVGKRSWDPHLRHRG